MSSESKAAGTVCVQLQFDGNGDRVVAVQEWMGGNYPHVQAEVSAAPGLIVSLRVPTTDERFDTWHGRLVAGLFPLDVAAEIVSQCFEQLDLPDAELLSVHLTDPPPVAGEPKLQVAVS